MNPKDVYKKHEPLMAEFAKAQEEPGTIAVVLIQDTESGAVVFGVPAGIPPTMLLDLLCSAVAKYALTCNPTTPDEPRH